MNTYKITIGTVDIISVISSAEWQSEDNLLEQDFTSWEEAYIFATELKDKLINQVFENENHILEEIW
jgi:hypothetical protein